MPGPLQCGVSIPPDFEILVDEPVSAGGTGKGPQPTDLLLASLASCYTLALVYSVNKLGLTADGIDVRLVGVDPDARPRLLQAAHGVCYVTNTLRNPPTITVDVMHS